MAYLRVWRFRPEPDHHDAFVAAYDPSGDWDTLFRRDPGFLGTELWRDRDGSFVTVDRWDDEAAFDRFQVDHGKAYRQLDDRLERFAGEEIFLGAFDVV